MNYELNISQPKPNYKIYMAITKIPQLQPQLQERLSNFGAYNQGGHAGPPWLYAQYTRVATQSRPYMYAVFNVLIMNYALCIMHF